MKSILRGIAGIIFIVPFAIILLICVLAVRLEESLEEN